MPDYIATSAFGLEAVVARELQALGYGDTDVSHGAVRFTADESAVARCNLWLRTADRLLIEVGRFSASDFGVLFDGAASLPWERWMGLDAAFPVRGKSVRSQLSSVPACQRVVKKALVERLRKAHGVVELTEDGPRFAVQVSLLNDEVSLTLDTTGAGLHKRGYRTGRGAAPLKETLAAALVQLSFWRPERPLIDPFCGTGTIPVEAALIGRNAAPGRQRSFEAESWPTLRADVWERARGEADDLLRTDVPLEVFGMDIDSDAIRSAKRNGACAGVDGAIHWKVADALDLRPDGQFGCVITNPPYGERLGEKNRARDLYRALPDALARMPTWSHFILAADAQFESLVGREADRRRKLYNGRIECTYYQFHGPPPARIAPRSTPQANETPSEPPDPPVGRTIVPAFGGLPANTAEQTFDFERRLAKMLRHTRRWPDKRGIDCYRLYHCDVPGVPLVVDRYLDCVHVTEYARYDEHAAGQHGAWLDQMLDVVRRMLEVPRSKLFVKTRHRQAGSRQHERLADRNRTLVVPENGLKFEINLTDYTDTGLFLDHRQTRAMVREQAEGRDVLNLFCYTGAFTVYALAGGARSTCSVDLSNTYLDWTRRNLALNGFAESANHRLRREDAFEFLRRSPAERYDLAIVDPPTFSNSKNVETVFDVQRDHRELLEAVLRVLRPGGLCFFSTNRRKFRLQADELADACEIREITNQTLPEDFQRARSHRCWCLRRQE